MRDLWRAVLTHGLADVAKGQDATWIGSRDFRLVCSLAGLDPEAVQTRFDPERFRRLIAYGERKAELRENTAA